MLKKAGVVDAGGQGLIVIFEGMQTVFNGGEVIELASDNASAAPVQKNAAAEFDGDITFTYCTEFIVHKNEDSANCLKLRAYLETIGDSVVAVDDEDIIKIHVHTDNPGKALQEGLKHGSLHNLKIENMREQHENKVTEAQVASEVFGHVPVDENIPFGFVAIAAGEGIKQLFCDLGCTNVVSGGQTMNPSTDDILRAIEATPAKTVFVLPNNKNIIMAAEQTIALADRKVYVIPTRTIPQGLSAMLAFDPELGIKENQINMGNACDSVATGQITFAARDSDFDGHKIKQGEILALDGGKLAFVDTDLTKTFVKLTKSLVKRDSSFITVMYGEGVTEEEADESVELLKAKISSDIEINVINGGQPVYYYIISVE